MCYEQKVDNCIDSINVTGLTAATAYTATLTDYYGQEYDVSGTSDGAGALNIDLTGLPDNSTMPFSKMIILKIDGIIFTRCGEQVDCLGIYFSGVGNIIKKSDV